jgi:hypothetical protein
MPGTYQSAVVPAPADAAWRVLRGFHDLSWAPDVVTSCAPVGDLRGDQVGARRLLNGCFHETLLALDDLERTLRYRLDDGPSPVSPAEVRNFVATVRVRPVTDEERAFVEWSASWDARDEAAVEFATGIYRSLLAALKTGLASAGGPPENG